MILDTTLAGAQDPPAQASEEAPQNETVLSAVGLVGQSARRRDMHGVESPNSRTANGCSSEMLVGAGGGWAAQLQVGLQVTETRRENRRERSILPWKKMRSLCGFLEAAVKQGQWLSLSSVK